MHDCQKIISKLNGEDTSEVREAAYQAGIKSCREAVTALADLLKDDNIGVQEAADRALREIGGAETVAAVAPLLRSERAPVRNLSMDILREVGSQDLDALVALLEDDDKDVRIFISDILGSTQEIGAVAPLSRALLYDAEVNVRYQAAVSLGALGFIEAAEVLAQAMKDEEWVQYAVVEARAKIGDAQGGDALLEALEGTSELVQSMIIDALGGIGTAKAASMLLQRLSNLKGLLLQKASLAIVGILGGNSLNLLSNVEREYLRKSLLESLDDDDPETQDAAMHGLAFLGAEDASWAILNIAAGLDPDADAERVQVAIETLTGIGMNPALEKGMNAGDPRVALIAIEALGHINQPGSSQAIMNAFPGKPLDQQRSLVESLLAVAGVEAKDFFIKVLREHQDGKVLRVALRFFGQKVRSEDALDLLFSYLGHEYNDVKEAALDACIAIGGTEVTNRFVSLVNDVDPINRLMGTYALGRLNALEHLDVLRGALEDSSPDVRKVALESVGAMCHDQEDILPLVAARLQDEHPEVRLAVVELMGSCGEQMVLPHLLLALDDQDDWVRIRAIEALAGLGFSEAIEPLRALVENPNRLLGIKALEALGAIGGKESFHVLLQVSGSDDPELADAAQAAIETMQQAQGGSE